MRYLWAFFSGLVVTCQVARGENEPLVTMLQDPQWTLESDRKQKVIQRL